MPRADIFHPDFTPTPYWWDALRPVAGSWSRCRARRALSSTTSRPSSPSLRLAAAPTFSGQC